MAARWSAGRDLAVVGAAPDAEPCGAGGVATAVQEAVQVVALPLFEEVREGYLEIRDAQTHEVVTVIEVLSPEDKTPTIRHDEYRAKRLQVLRSRTSLVEIDLLRSGRPMPVAPLPASDYRILVRCGWQRSRATLYPFGVRQPIPEVPVPLRRDDVAARLALGEILPQIYDRARYDLRLDYVQQPDPPLGPEDAAWAGGLLHERPRRQAGC